MKKHILYPIVLVALFLSGCVETIDFSRYEDKRVVVNCLLTRDTVQKLTLNYTSPLGENYYEEVTQAKITLLENDIPIGEFQKTGYAEWKLNFRARFRQNYSLNIEIPGKELITATTVFPSPVYISRLRELDNKYKKFYQKDSIELVNPRVFWAFAFQKKQDTVMIPIVIEPTFRLYQSIGTDYPKVDDFNSESADKFSGTTKKYFVYLRMLPDADTDRFFLEELYSSVVVFRAVSDEYDHYLKSGISKMLVYKSFNDPSRWLDESEIYTNVENGLGIFGAYYDRMFNYNPDMGRD
ncbi:MAG: DUF4249 family protein [Paludibacteraceae bacterium]